MRKGYRQRLANEYLYAVTKMQEAKDPARKLFYFSIFFGEAQRTLNLEWNRELALIYTITQHVHAQINTVMQMPGIVLSLPIDWVTLYEKLTQTASDLTAFLGNPKNENNIEELCHILGRFAEIAYVVSGNGSYLYEKGLIKL